MRFASDRELVLFGESVAGALAGWEPPLEPALGSWWDERDDALAERLEALGWAELWSDAELLGAAIAGGLELGRAVAPLSLVDEATLGAPLALGERSRHAEGRDEVAVVVGSGVGLVRLVARAEREPTLDGTGTLSGLDLRGPKPFTDGGARLRAWGAVTLAYLAGLADAALGLGLEHVRAREQFGAPLAALPVVQGRLADAALLRDGLVLSAWGAAASDAGLPVDALSWAGPACREVAAQALQVHGALGFALEGGVHRYLRRAKVVQVWTDAVVVAARAA